MSLCTRLRYSISSTNCLTVSPGWKIRESCLFLGGAPYKIVAHHRVPGAFSRVFATGALQTPLPQIPPSTGPWEGLQAYRKRPLDFRWTWGEKGAEVDLSENDDTCFAANTADTLAACGRAVLLTADPVAKVRMTHQAFAAWTAGQLPIGTSEAPAAPARPDKPRLVNPQEIPSYKDSPLPLSVYLLHNLAHVELNAIDLAWDTLVRFSSLHPSLPTEFFDDFARVADDEARHLGWCLQRLGELDHQYGDMDAHRILWDGAESTAGDITARLALVPCIQEARGLDAGPRLVKRLRGGGDIRSADIVERISTEELAHVAVGVSWFTQVCSQLEVDAQTSFQQYVLAHVSTGRLQGPFNYEARDQVGLMRDWYEPMANGPSCVWPKPAKHRRGTARDRAAASGDSSQDQSDPVISKKDKRREERRHRKAMVRARRQQDLQSLHGRLANVLMVESAAASDETLEHPNKSTS